MTSPEPGTSQESRLEEMGLGGRPIVVPLEDAWSASVGFEYRAGDDGTMAGTLEVTPAVCQPLGLVHGGVYACISEELASVGTAMAVRAEGKWCVGMSNMTHFMRPAKLGGRIDAVARPIHRGRTTWVWEVDMANELGKPCARSTVTMAVREGEPPR